MTDHPTVEAVFLPAEQSEPATITTGARIQPLKRTKQEVQDILEELHDAHAEDCFYVSGLNDGYRDSSCTCSLQQVILYLRQLQEEFAVEHSPAPWHTAQAAVNAASGGEHSGPGEAARAWENAGHWHRAAQIEHAANELLLSKLVNLEAQIASLNGALLALAQAAKTWVEQWSDLYTALIDMGLLEDPKYSEPFVPNFLFTCSVDAFEEVRAALAEVPPELLEKAEEAPVVQAQEGATQG